MSAKNVQKNEINTINESVNNLISRICKSDGLTKKGLAERLGTSDISLSLTLSSTGSVITTKKLIEIATALGRKVVIGVMSDDEITALKEKMTSHEISARNDVFTCPNCGKKYKLVPIEDEEVNDNEETSENSNLIVCDPMEADLEARNEMVRKMMATRQAKESDKNK